MIFWEFMPQENVTLKVYESAAASLSIIDNKN